MKMSFEPPPSHQIFTPNEIVAELQRSDMTYPINIAKLVDDVRKEVKIEVEDWFSNVSLDDLFDVKGWER